MKILLLSDLHLEFAPLETEGVLGRDCDVVVLAGDIGEGTRGIKWARQAFPGQRIVYVSGNHEFYHHDWDRTLDELRAAAGELEIDFLENDEVVIGDVRFLGCTLWVDFNYFGDGTRESSMLHFERGLNDCQVIRADALGSQAPKGQRRLTAAHVLHRHQQSRQWLEGMLAKPSQKTFVVTHHAPCIRSVVERYRSDPLTPGFASDLPAALIQAANVWVHGHMHDSSDYVVNEGGPNETRIVCNPRGYPLRSGCFENPVFELEKIITI